MVWKYNQVMLMTEQMVYSSTEMPLFVHVSRSSWRGVVLISFMKLPQGLTIIHLTSSPHQNVVMIIVVVIKTLCFRNL